MINLNVNKERLQRGLFNFRTSVFYGYDIQEVSDEEVLNNICAGVKIIQCVGKEREKTKDPSPFDSEIRNAKSEIRNKFSIFKCSKYGFLPLWRGRRGREKLSLCTRPHGSSDGMIHQPYKKFFQRDRETSWMSDLSWCLGVFV
ncbi:MAG: hypothetical protein E3K32_03320 [wastewater metagenome]|nr:hypothetical protein [Candidatus Loosdrechtia aerotolerans]